jgi:uncharacterized delta-60 repeat protein
MKKILLLSIIFTGILSGLKAQVNIQWQTRYTSSGTNVDKAEDLVMDASGNVYVTGIGRGASGNFDYITIKYNSAGAQQWIAEYNGPGNSLDEAHAVCVDGSGNVYVTGWSYGGASTGYDYATVKYNSAGVQQWAARYNHTTNGTDEAWDVGVDNSGNVYVTGSSDGSGSNSAAATVKYSSAGAQTALIRFDGAGGGIDAGYAIYVDAATGTSYVSGYTFQSTANDFNFLTLKYNSSLVQQWFSQYNGPDANYDEAHAITVDAAGNVYVSGYTQTAVLTNYNFATVKYNSSGAQQWAQTYNGTGDDYDRANAVKVDASGNVYVTGKSVGAGSDAEDVLTIKYDNAGVAKWTARYNGPSADYDEGKAVEVDAAGNVYVTGYSFATGYNNDYVTIKYDSTGTQQWLTRYNGTGNNSDQAVALALDPAGNVFITGVSRGAGTVEDFETIKYCQLTSDAGPDVSICTGASVTLNANATGAVSYAWTPATGLSDPTIASPIANPTTTTTYIVAITNTSGCVDVDTMVLTVLPLPAPSITASGPTSFCIGDSVTLTAAAASSYLWSSSATDTLQSITVYTTGTYSVTISNGTGCASNASIGVTVFSLPTIDAGLNDSICLSDNANLMATGGASYVWSPSGSLSDPNIANPVAGPTSTTTYTVVGTSAAGCQSTDSVTVYIVANPGVPSISRGSDTLYCSPSASAYQWYLNGSAIAGATNSFYVFTANGNYYVEVFNSFGCSTVSTITTISDVGVEELGALSLMEVYPNPTEDMITLELNAAKASDLKLTIMNVSGQVVYAEEMTQLYGPYQKSISLKKLAKGVYQLQLISNEGIINKKIVRK